MFTTGPLQQQLTVQVNNYNYNTAYLAIQVTINYIIICLLSLGTDCWDWELHVNTGVLIVYITTNLINSYLHRYGTLLYI